MNSGNIAQFRLRSQQLVDKKQQTLSDLIRWMGAIQAQDYPMAKWAIGLRLIGATEKLVEAAIDSGEILRTHLLRPTWHFVAAEDIYWLLELTAPQIKAAQKSRDRELELTEEVYTRSNAIIEKALSHGTHLTREELVAELRSAGFTTDQNRASHLLVRAEVEKIICSGMICEGKPTYALLAERVKHRKTFEQEEASFELAKRYFTSRFPATQIDFSWWSGLPATIIRQALDQLKNSMHLEEIQGKHYFIPNDFIPPEGLDTATLLLPPYDEFILSYADRSISISRELESHMREISDRGVFRPIIVIDGQVFGTWKRIKRRNSVMLELKPFLPYDKDASQAIQGAAREFGNFLNYPVDIIIE